MLCAFWPNTALVAVYDFFYDRKPNARRLCISVELCKYIENFLEIRLRNPSAIIFNMEKVFVLVFSKTYLYSSLWLVVILYGVVYQVLKQLAETIIITHNAWHVRGYGYGNVLRNAYQGN